MLKTTAINLMGGSVRATAVTLTLSTQAVSKWNERGSVPRPVCDKVIAHIVREACKQDDSLRVQLQLPLDALLLPPEPPAKKRRKLVMLKTHARQQPSPPENNHEATTS